MDTKASDSDCETYSTEDRNSIVQNNQKHTLSAEILVAVGGLTYHGLSDSSTSGTLTRSDFVKSREKLKKNEENNWQTQAGRFSTKYTYLMSDMTLPQFTSNRKLNFTVNGSK